MKLGKQKIISIIALLIATAIAVIFLLPKLSPVNDQEGRVSQDGVLGGSIAISNDGGKIYEDTDYGFSFFYPENFSIGAFADEEGTKTILVQNAEKNTGVQIFISAFDENITLTPERIKKDVPDIAMSDVKSISVGQEQRSDLGVPALRSDLDANAVSFNSNNSTGQSREVWFVYKSNLYQISAPIAASGILDTIITIWHFN